MPTFTIICRTDLPRDAVAKLDDGGLYRSTADSSSEQGEHQLVIEADDADLAIERARAEIIAAGGDAGDLEVAG